MFDRILLIPSRIVEILALGEPIPRLWSLYFGFGAVAFGMLSYPAEDVAYVLIPMFLAAGFLNLYGCIITYTRNKKYDAARKIVGVGLSLMIMASWTRGILVWGIEQHGVGSQILASVVWIWITVGSCFLFMAVWQRGLR